eukprot:TRINITY_DN17366_c0_g1_i1.p6 TRINITY_DN17366_c0_g1~~TRINITY_DN17366_c0_g1_i1.p6  ORF type:complete len:122 (-),score=7.32 TRINITY_DN17366_c0_g1_i1:602-967(-)
MLYHGVYSITSTCEKKYKEKLPQSRLQSKVIEKHVPQKTIAISYLPTNKTNQKTHKKTNPIISTTNTHTHTNLKLNYKNNQCPKHHILNRSSKSQFAEEISFIVKKDFNQFGKANGEFETN